MSGQDMQESGSQPDRPGSWGPPSPGTVTLKAVVNGMLTNVQAGPDELLRAIVQLALDETGNQGRPVDEWTVTDDIGRPLDPARRVAELSLEDFDTVFIQVQVGAGG
jgi:hypothetical protein